MSTLKLFGSASLECESGPLTGPASQRHRLALLAILAVSHPRGVGREKLMACLWPERDVEHARQLLNQSVYVLRRALGEEVILSAADELRLNAEVLGVDVIDFEAALAAGDLEQAVRLYEGPFLDGFLLSNAPEFEQWAERERERLRRAYAPALEQLAGRAVAAGNASGAVEWWRRLAAEEPYNARVTLRLMEALEVAGDRAGALQQARVHAALMEQEFAAAPDAEVAVLAERLRLRAAEPLESGPHPSGATEAELIAPPTGRGSTMSSSAAASGAPPASTSQPSARGRAPKWGLAAAGVRMIRSPCPGSNAPRRAQREGCELGETHRAADVRWSTRRIITRSGSVAASPAWAVS